MKPKDEQWEEEDFEKMFVPGARKEQRQERKIASNRDRSKYKLTDQKKREKAVRREQSHLQHKLEGTCRGRVLEASSKGFSVEWEGELFLCSLKGALKKEKRQVKALVVVGDFVFFEKAPGHEGVIVHVEERRSELCRADNLHHRKQQFIAANIDQVLITASVVSPPLKPGLLDRYIIAAKKGNMSPVIVINKVDLLSGEEVEGEAEQEHIEEQRALFDQVKEAYGQVGIPVIEISVAENKGWQELKEVMKGCASVFSGQSGVGKTSIINGLTGGDLAVGEVVERTRKGAHTTTTTRLLTLEDGGVCVDTPGIKSFGVWSLEQRELEAYFTEIHQVGRECKFVNCTHQHEPGCAVKEAVDGEEISWLRYSSYLSLMEQLGEEHRPR